MAIAIFTATTTTAAAAAAAAARNMGTIVLRHNHHGTLFRRGRDTIRISASVLDHVMSAWHI